MISVADALEKLLALAAPMPVEEVPLIEAHGRVLVRDAVAQRTQPPFAASAMDGYAVRGAPALGQEFEVIGEAAAGHGFDGAVSDGQAVRIFTGAPVPKGASHVVIQENICRDGDQITITDAPSAGDNIRPAGGDFQTGDTLSAPRVLTPVDIALLAAMNIARVPVYRRPDVAIIATGDELVQPGETPGPDQIIASNSYGLHALLTRVGAAPRLLPIARDNMASLQTVFDLARGADLILTIGGASVGDHDLVAPALADRGMERSFYKVAMRPGKPLMAGRLDDAVMIGLPGNPVSAMVCGQLFVAPIIRTMLGAPDPVPALRSATLAQDLPANGPRQHYLRAKTTAQGVLAFDKQDSSLLSILSEADCLIVQPPHDPPRTQGSPVDILPL